jgi:hypothetical protein
MHALLGALLGLILVARAEAQIHLDIGIHFPASPQLVVVPQVPVVRYVPAGPANLFHYDGQYWVFTNGAWHVSQGHNGPWITVAPRFVPRPVLLVPVYYYHVRPGHWQKWAHHHPPHWHHEWGRDWAHRREWKHRDRDDDDDDDDGRKVRKGRGRGRGRD